ncbi:replication initiation protein [Ligilactobacillus sp. LYQ135]
MTDHYELSNKVNDLNNKVVAQNNDLIKSFPDMRLASMKIFEIAVGAVDTSAEKIQREVFLKKNAIYDALEQTGNNRTTRLREAMEQLQQQALFHLLPSKETRGHEIIISPISKIEWDDKEDYVSLSFTPDILPYITKLKENFTQYKLEYVLKLNSRHAVTIYKILVMSFNKYMNYKKSNNVPKEKLLQWKNPTISVKELRSATGTRNTYPNFAIFRKNVLDKAVNEINEKTNLIVNYDKIRSGRHISDIQFHIEQKNANAAQEDSKHIETVKQTQDERELENAKIYADAMGSQYTQMLMERMLLNPADMTNQSTMIELGKNVYPKYQKIKTEQGFNTVKMHLDYVHDHIGDWNRHTNIAKYLNKAVDDYINKLK